MEKKYLIDELKKNGFRITKQREMLLDIILENMCFINRKNMYRIACSETCKAAQGCLIEFDDDSKLELSGTDWNKVIYEGLKGLQLLDNRNIRSILYFQCSEGE